MPALSHSLSPERLMGHHTESSRLPGLGCGGGQAGAGVPSDLADHSPPSGPYVHVPCAYTGLCHKPLKLSRAHIDSGIPLDSFSLWIPCPGGGPTLLCPFIQQTCMEYRARTRITPRAEGLPSDSLQTILGDKPRKGQGPSPG